MNGIDIFEKDVWRPLSVFGITHPFFDLNAETILYTWVAIACITVIAIFCRISLRSPQSPGGYIVRRCGQAMIDLMKQSTVPDKYRYFAFFTSLFIFILICNCLVIVPLLEEPTKDLNSTLALAITSFLFTQTAALQTHGIFPYLNEFFKTPLRKSFLQIFKIKSSYKILIFFEICLRTILNIIIAIALFPLELLGKLASVLSLSFRLFGNIFGGAVIGSIWASFKSNSILLQAFGLVSGINFAILFFFGLFEGLLQAFVFSALSLTYLGMAIQSQHAEE